MPCLELGKSRWNNVNRPPNDVQIFMKKIFSVKFLTLPY